MMHDAMVTEVMGFWIRRIGDGYVLSLPNTILYACAFIAAVYRWRSLRETGSALREQRLWLFLAFVLLALGINKQLNFQTLLIELGRYAAQHEGWYEKRRLVQACFAYALSGVIGCAILAAMVAMKGLWRNNAPALAGLTILCLYTVLRATVMNHIDVFAGLRSQGRFRITDAIEFLGILCIFINALKRPKDG